YIDATIKPATIWNPNKYMNMWVCGISGGILGYATFPNPGTSGLAGLSPPFGSTTTDGLVMLNTAFGSVGTASAGAPYNKGRTATHEIGHWLGLRHIWGDAGQCGATDYCNDTPPQKGGTASPAGCNYNCPTYPFQANTCTLSGQSNTNGDMFMNYMDYTNDACMYMFTNDQKTRAQLIMTNSPMRLGLITSTVCNSPTVVNDIGILYVSSPTFSQNITCSTSINPSVMLYNYGTNTITTATFSYNVSGVGTQTTPWSGVIAPSSSLMVGLPMITGLSSGNKVYNIGIYSPNGTTDPNMNNNASNQPFTMSGQMSLIASANTTICLGNSATLTASGASNYTWLPINSTGSAAVVSPSVTSNYTVYASNSVCATSTVINVAVGGLLTLSVSANQTICAGTSLTLQASGATSYSWNTGVSSNAINVSPSVTTVYTVTGYSGSCFDTKTISVSIGTLPISINSLSLCAGGAGTLTATGASNFTWSTASNSQSIVVNPSITTTYSVLGSNGTCTGTAIRVVTVSALPVITVLTNPICQGMSIVFSPTGACSYTYSSGTNTITPAASSSHTILGANCTSGCVGICVVNVTVNPSPTLNVVSSQSAICVGNAVTLSVSSVGNAASTYTWFNGSNSTSISITPSISGTYSVSGTGSGCTGTTNTSVGVNALPVITVSSYTICSGGSATLSPSGANTYSWNTGSNLNSIVVTPSANTTYTVSGANLNNCVNTATVSVSLGSSLSVLINAPVGICTGNSATLSASGANSYTWSNNANTSSIVVNPTGTNTYSVIGASGSCTGSAIQTISVSAPPAVSIASAPSISICPGSNATLTASGATNYTWSNGGSGSQIVVSPSVNTVYTATGTSNGCSNTASVGINTGGAAINLTVNASANSVCAGSQATLYVIGAATYSWSTGATAFSIVVSPTATSIYTVTGNNGTCQGIATKTINIIPSSTIAVNANPSFTVCLGKSLVLTASGSFSNYTWSNSSATGNTISLTPIVTSSYTVSAGSGTASCPSLNIFSVVVNPNPVSSLSVTNASCGNSCNGQLNAFTNGGNSPYTYSLSGTTCSSIPCANLCAGLYTLNTTDNTGCKSFNIFSVSNTQNTMIANITATHATCGTCADGVLSVNPSGGTAPFNYVWAPSGGTTAIASGLATGCYTVTVTDARGCTTKSWDCVGIATGIDGKVLMANDLQLFPNPTKGLLNVQLSGFTFNYALYSSIGQLLAFDKNVNNGTSIHVETLAKGIYIVEISVGDAVIRKKIVKE
ncbi:MAG: zinc-dependent metalloprotease, partial [Bacteroidota bacterium]